MGNVRADIFKSVFCFILFKEIANFQTTEERAVGNAHACRISTPRQGDIDIRYGVGVDCLFVV